VVWLVSYPVLLAWYFPEVTEYYLKTLPPLFLLLVLGGTAADRPALRRGAGLSLLLLTVAVNFWGAIWPWYRYGRDLDEVRRWVEREVRPDDLFISLESGLDNTVKSRARLLPLKGLFTREGRDGVRLVRDAIEADLVRGRRVFAYNLVPAPYSLRGMNAGRKEPLGRHEFEEFLLALRQGYVFREVLLYWEEAHEPLYLYGERLQPLWEVRRQTPYESRLLP
jgi:hypothetical protein